MARRSKPYELRWPFSSRQLENIDEMFRLLFEDTFNGKLTIDAGQVISGTLAVARGGTGIGSYTTGDLLYATSATTLDKLADIATGSVLRSGGVGVAPAWGKVGLTTHVSGVLPVANGGTNISAYTIGDLLYASGATSLAVLADVASGAYLRSGGVATAPVWSTLTLPNAASQGDIFIATASNAMTVLAKNTTATRYLSNTGGSNNPAWAQVDLTNGVTGILPVANGGSGVNNTTQTYTPTLTNVANLDASTAYQLQYMRIGQMVIVSGKVDIDPTLAATLTTLGISLPIASNIGAVEDVGGVAFASGIATQGAAIIGDAANDRAQLTYIAGDVTNQPMYIIFAYQVI